MGRRSCGLWPWRGVQNSQIWLSLAKSNVRRNGKNTVPWSVWLSAGHMLWDLAMSHFMLQYLHQKGIMNAWYVTSIPPHITLPGLLYGFLFVLMIRFRQMAADTPELFRRQSITELVGVKESRIILIALCVTPTFLWLHPHDLCPRTQPFPRRVMWDWTKPVSRDWSHVNAWKGFPVSAGLAVPRWRSHWQRPAVRQFAPHNRTIQVQVFF